MDDRGPGKVGKRVLLEGRPGAGKTTAARRVAALLRESRVAVTGFITEEIREGGTRKGFRVETMAGESAVLAHVGFPGPPRVGKYGVDLEAFERLAIPEVEREEPGAVAVLDELGKMELASRPFQSAIGELFESGRPVVATVHAHRHPFTDRLKRRSGIELVKVTRANRDELPEQVAGRFRSG